MSKEQQRMAIAEVCGWKAVRAPRSIAVGTEMSVLDARRKAKEFWHESMVPDYFNDLNAMAEAERTLTEDQHDSFRDHLLGICLRDWKAGKCITPHPISATAAQRSEAFLRVVRPDLFKP